MEDNKNPWGIHILYGSEGYFIKGVTIPITDIKEAIDIFHRDYPNETVIAAYVWNRDTYLRFTTKDKNETV